MSDEKKWFGKVSACNHKNLKKSQYICICQNKTFFQYEDTTHDICYQVYIILYCSVTIGKNTNTIAAKMYKYSLDYGQ